MSKILKTNQEHAQKFSSFLNDEELSYVQDISNNHARGYFKHTLAFAVLLKFYEREGRPPQNHDLIPLDLLDSLSHQLNIPIEDCEGFNWQGRSAERFRGKIRDFLGYRKAKLSDIPGLSKWLKDKIHKEGLTLSQCRVAAYSYLQSNKLEPFKPSVLNTRVSSIYKAFETSFFKRVSKNIPVAAKQSLDALLESSDESMTKPSAFMLLKDLKKGTKGRKKSDIELEILKLERLRAIELSEDIFLDFSYKLLETYFHRIISELPSEIKAHPGYIRYTMLACFCFVKSRRITDTLAEQFSSCIQTVRKKSEKATNQYVLKNVTCVGGKFDILYSLAHSSLTFPKARIETAIYPKVSQATLKDLVTDLKHKGKWYDCQVCKNMHPLYVHHARSILMSILGVLTLKSNNPSQEGILKALELIKSYSDNHDKWLSLSEAISIEDLLPPIWHSVIWLDDGSRSKKKIQRHYFEIAVFEELRKRLHVKDIWILGSHTYRDPDEDVPQDFYSNIDEYLNMLKWDANPDVLINDLKNQMETHLSLLNEGLPTNKHVKIITKGKSRFQLSPYVAQDPPQNLDLLQREIQKRWSSVNLLDLLREVDIRTNFTRHFSTVASRQIMDPEVLRKRLLLCLCALGNNTGLKRMSAANGDESYSDLRYVKRKFINAPNLRNALVEIINNIIDIRDPKIWGTGLTGCACDSTQVSSWDQNLLSQWHPRYRKPGVMIYWHVDKKSLCIHSQLKSCSSSEVAAMMEGVLRHSTNMDMNQTYMDTNGQNTIGFAFSHILYLELLPRIKGIHRQILSRPNSDPKSKYSNLEGVLGSPIRWHLIREQYTEILKYTAALRMGTAETEVLLKRFSKDNYQHPTYQALLELGKAVKTIFLCKYLHNEDLRIEINEALNVVERVNGVMDFFFYGKLGELSTNNLDDQEITILSLHLLQTCLVHINTLMIQEILQDQEWCDKLTPEDKRALTPLIHTHINPYGLFPLNMDERLPLHIG